MLRLSTLHGRRRQACLAERSNIHRDYGVILSPAAADYLEEMAVKATWETRRIWQLNPLFTPLYIANYCENHCVYCGLTAGIRSIGANSRWRKIEAELVAIAATGLKEILLLTGESRLSFRNRNVGEAVKLATRYFATIGLEIYPLNVDEYAYLHQCGVDFVSVYQETYNIKKYVQVHLKGPKQVFAYRFHSQERALQGGMRGVALGALLGLDDFRKDAFSVGMHAQILLQKFPHAEISFSVPRLRPYLKQDSSRVNGVRERDLLQVLLAYRLFMPFAGITISTRERAGFRDHVIGMAATKISAGVCVGVGGQQAEEQVTGNLKLRIHAVLSKFYQASHGRGLQPVYADYLRVYSGADVDLRNASRNLQRRFFVAGSSIGASKTRCTATTGKRPG